MVFLGRASIFYPRTGGGARIFSPLDRVHTILSGLVGVGGYFFATHFSIEFPKSTFFYFREASLFMVGGREITGGREKGGGEKC